MNDKTIRDANESALGTLSRRTFVRGTLAAGAGLTGAAWFGSGHREAHAKAEKAATPKRGGTLQVGGINDLNPKGVPFRLQASTTGQVVPTVFGGLLRYTDSLTPTMHMAETFELSKDATSAHLKLKKGIEYHSGRNFTVDDVKWNLQKAAEKAQRSQVRQLAEAITEMKLDGKHDITLKFARPMANFADLLVITLMADRETFDQVPKGTFVGTGPFMLKEWRPKELVHLVRNPNYFAGEPYLNDIVFRQFSDNQAMGLALDSGDIQYINEQVQPEDAERWEHSRNIALNIVYERGLGWYVGLNTKKAPFTDVRVRKAINLAMNRKRYMNEALLYGRVMTTPWPDFSPAFNKEIDSQIEFDLDAAKALLAEAGYPNGIPEPITVTLLPTRLPQVRVGEILQNDLEKIGVKLKFKQTEYAEMIEMLATGTFEPMWIGFGFGFAQFQPATTVQTAFPLRYPNTSNYDDPEWIAAVEGIINASGDEAALKQAYDRYTQAFVNGHFVLVYATRAAINARRKNLVELLNVYGASFYEGFGFV